MANSTVAHAAEVTGVSSISANGTYSAGVSISIQVDFDEPVDVDTTNGVPTITLETGAVDALASYSGGSGSTALTFTYTIAVGHSSADLDYVSPTAVSLNGSTITNSLGNVATLLLPPPGATGSLSANSAIVIDGVRPTVSTVTAASNGIFREGQTVDVQVVFNESVIVSGVPQITLETGAIDAVVDYQSGSGSNTLIFRYTVAAGHNSNDLDYISSGALTLNDGDITDTAGNAAILTLPNPGGAGSLSANSAIVVDGVRPTVSRVTGVANGTFREGQTVDVQVVFNESIIVSGVPQITLETGAIDAVVDYQSGSGSNTLIFRYTVAAGHNSNDLDYISAGALTLNDGDITDTAGNAATLTLPNPGAPNSLGHNRAIIIDTIAPTVTLVTSTTANGAYRAGQAVNIRVTFSEAVIVTGTPQIILETGVDDAVVNYSAGSNSSNINFTYTIAAGHTSADLDYLSSDALTGIFRDAAGNDAILSLPVPGAVGSLSAGKDLVVDTSSPTLTLDTAFSSPTSTYPIPVTVTFPENITGLTLSDFVVTNGCVSNLSGSGATYTLDLHPNSNNTITLELPAGRVIDVAGNNNIAATPLSIDFYTDAPRVTSVTSTSPNAAYKEGGLISVQVNFSEPVDVGGVPRLTLETGSSDAVVDYVGGSGSSSLTFNYTVAAGHTSSDLDYQSVAPLSLNGGSIRDTASLSFDAALIFACPAAAGSLAANQALVVDTQKPTVLAVTSTTSNGAYKAGSEINVTVNFSETVNVTGFPRITLETGASDAVAEYVAGSGSSALVFSFTIQSGENSADLDYVSTTALALNGGTIADLAGNDATLTLPTPGAANSLGSNKAIVVDTTPPIITNVTASNANGSYTVGTTINTQVVFSEPVVVTGSPRISLDAGVRTANVAYTSGSATSTLRFDYAIQAGDTSSDLSYVSASALSANGGTLRDPAGNDAVLTLAAPGASGSLNANKNIIVDTTAPIVLSVSSSTPDGYYAAGATISIQVQFSENVTVTATPQLALSVGAAANATYTSGSGTATLTFNYTVGAGHNSNDLDYVATNSLSGTIRDAATNSAILTLAPPGSVGSLSHLKALVIDTTTATITSVTSSTLDGHYKEGSAIALSVTFSEVVTVAGSPTLTLETGTVDGVATYTGGSGSTVLSFLYTVGAGQNSSDLEVAGSSALSLAGGSIRDNANLNANLTISLPALSASKALVVDTTMPQAAVSSTAPSSSNTSPIPFTITFTEPVTGFSAAGLSVTNGTISDFVAVSSTVYTASVSPVGQGAVEVSVLSSSAVDSATNPNSASTSFVRIYDTIAPTVILSSAVGNRTNLGQFPVSVIFSESISGLTLEEVIVTNGTASDLQGSGDSYTVVIAPNAEGEVTVTIGAGAALDNAGNTSMASNILTRVYDTTGPSASLSSSVNEFTNANPIPVIFTFSEDVFGFSLSDIHVTNGTASGLTMLSQSTYRADITPVVDGQVEVWLESGVVQDAAGNDSVASSTFTRTFDSTAPTVTLSSSAPAVTNSSPIPFEINFTDAVTGFSAGGIAVTNGTVVSLSGSGSSYLISVVPISDGVVSVAIIAGAAADSAGNGNLPSGSISRLFDSTAVPVSVSSAITSAFNTSVLAVHITFDEPVDGLTADDLNVSNGSVTSLSGSGTTYLAEIAPTTEGLVAISLAAGVVVDGAGNSNLASNLYSVIYDITAPTVTVTTSVAEKTNVTPWSISIVFSENVHHFVAGDISVINGVVTSISGSGKNYTASVSPSMQGAVRISIGALVSQDSAGNPNLSSNEVVRTFDTEAPNAPVIVAPSNGAVLTTSTPTIQGTGEPNAAITVYDGEAVLCSATVDQDGAWSCIAAQMEEGRHSIRAYAIDGAENTGFASASSPIVIDAIPLTSPVVMSSVGDITTDTTPTVSGSGPIQSIVRVRFGSTVVCMTTVDEQGRWSCQTAELPTGIHNLVAWAQDPTDDTVSADVGFSVYIGIQYNGIVKASDLDETPLDGVSVSYDGISTTTSSAGTFALPVPDSAGVQPVLSKRGWKFTLITSEGGVYRYSARPALERRSFAVWDAGSYDFIQTLNLLNKGSSVTSLVTTLRKSDGSVCTSSAPITLLPDGDQRVPLDVDPCFGPGEFGYVQVDAGEDSEYEGDYESRVRGSSATRLRTGVTTPLTNSFFGPSYVSFDTGASVLKAQEQRVFVENSLIIANVSEREATFVVTHRESDGSEWRIEETTVPARASVRLVVGDITQRAVTSGFIEIIPEDDTIEYVAAQRRIGYAVLKPKNGRTAQVSSRFFVLNDYPRQARGSTFSARFRYANKLAGENYVEFVNPTSRRARATIAHNGIVRRPRRRANNQGNPEDSFIRDRSQLRVTVEAFGTTRIKFSEFIGRSKEGTLHVELDNPDSMLVNVVRNTYDATKQLVATKLTPLGVSYGDTMHSFYLANSPAAIAVANMGSSPVSATIDCIASGSIVGTIPVFVNGRDSVEALLRPCFGENGGGFVRIRSSQAGALGVDLLSSLKGRGVQLRTRLR